jgi:hypothetical protein
MSDGKFEKVCSQTSGETSSPPVPTSPELAAAERALKAAFDGIWIREDGSIYLEEPFVIRWHPGDVEQAYTGGFDDRVPAPGLVHMHDDFARGRGQIKLKLSQVTALANYIAAVSGKAPPSTDRSLPVRGAALEALQDLYDNEINCRLSTAWDGGVNWWLGGFWADQNSTWSKPDASGAEDTFLEAVWSIIQAALTHYPESEFAAKWRVSSDPQASQQDAPQTSSDGDQINPAPQEERGEQKNDLVSENPAPTGDDALSPVIPEGFYLLDDPAAPKTPRGASVEIIRENGERSTHGENWLFFNAPDDVLAYRIIPDQTASSQSTAQNNTPPEGLDDSRGEVFAETSNAEAGEKDALAAVPSDPRLMIIDDGPDDFTQEQWNAICRATEKYQQPAQSAPIHMPFVSVEAEAPAPDERPRSDAEGEGGSAARETLKDFLNIEKTNDAISQRVEDLDQDDLTRKAKEPEMAK